MLTNFCSLLTSFSKNPALIAIWFSFNLRASLDLLAAILFFLRRAQYFSSFNPSGTNYNKNISLIGTYLLFLFTRIGVVILLLSNKFSNNRDRDFSQENICHYRVQILACQIKIRLGVLTTSFTALSLRASIYKLNLNYNGEWHSLRSETGCLFVKNITSRYPSSRIFLSYKNESKQKFYTEVWNPSKVFYRFTHYDYTRSELRVCGYR